MLITQQSESDRDPRMNRTDVNQLLRETTERAIRYLDELPNRPCAPTPEAIAGLNDLNGPLAGEGMASETVLQQLDGICTPATSSMAGPRFFGFVIGGAIPVSIAANWLATAWDQCTGYFRPTPSTAAVEEVALQWLVDLFGLPNECAGGFVTGATVANFTSLAAARQSVLRRAGWNVEADGLFGAPPITVVVGEEVHPSVMKSLGLLGLGRNRVVRAPVDGQGRIDMAKFPRIDPPAIVCTQVGNVNTGAIDPVGKICENFQDQPVWVHVDGAFGLWAAASESKRELVSGIQHADSWATDAHKWLNVPYDSGIAFVRDAFALKSAMAITAEYLPSDTPHRNPSDFTPELSRRARGVDVWATLKHLGRQGVAELVDRCCRHAQDFAQGLSGAGYEILNEVVLNQVLVSFGSPAKTERVIQAIQEDGTCWCGGTIWQGRTAMRISTSNWATTDADIQQSLEAMIRLAADC